MTKFNSINISIKIAYFIKMFEYGNDKKIDIKSY